MTTLSPRRDAMVEAVASARSAAEALPAAQNRIEEINREISHGVLEAALVPIAEAMDLGADGQTATGMLVNALANTIVSHCLSCAGSDEEDAQRYGIMLIHTLIDRCRLGFREPADVEVVQDVHDAAPGRPQ